MRGHLIFFALCSLAALVLLSVPGAAEVSYEYSLTDEVDDILDMTTMEVGSMPAIDILSVATTTSGETFEVGMVLATNYTEEAEYLVVLLIDETTESTFGWDSTQGFYWWDARYDAMNVTGSFSPGGDELHWKIPKEDLNATSEVWILHGDAKLLVDHYARWQDSVWEVVIPARGRISADILYYMVLPTDLVKHVEIRLNEFDSDDLREIIDSDSDLTVTDNEVFDYIDAFRSTDPDWEYGWITLNGDQPIWAERTLRLTNASGPVYSSDPITMTMIRTLEFPDQGSVRYLKYEWTEEFTTEEGVVPWEVSDDSSFTFEGLSDDSSNVYLYSLNHENVSYLMKSYISADNKTYHMSGSDMRAVWNDTIGDTMGYDVRQKRWDGGKGEEQEEDTMCNSSWIVFAILPTALLIPRRGTKVGRVHSNPGFA
jgi:hypothetical protein